MDALGGITGLNYADDYRTVGGIVARVTSRVAEPLLLSIDLRDISFDTE